MQTGPARRLAAALALAPLLAWAQDCRPHVEEFPNRTEARFRAHTMATSGCPVSESTYRDVTARWLRERQAAQADPTSLALGRAVDFPWLSRRIADAALELPGWAARVARTRRPGAALAAPALRHPEILQRLAAPFEGSPYRVTGLGFEKVLYGPARDHATGRPNDDTPVPFDAQLWLRLAPRRP